MNHIFISVIISLSLIGSAHGQVPKIEVSIPNLKNQQVILGHHFNAQLMPDDTIKLDAKGYGVFKDKKLYPGGMYFLFLPNRNLFDFLLDKDQEFLITADTSDFLNSVSFKGSEENTIFVDFQKSMFTFAKEQEVLTKKREEFISDAAKLNEIDKKLNELNTLRNNKFEGVISKYPDMFFSKFLKATRRVEVPATITDQKDQYFYFRMHFFDPFDVSDPRLLRTPIYEGTIDQFLDKVLIQHPDTLIKEIDKLVEKSRTNEELFRFMLVHLFNKYASSQLMTAENVYVHIAEKYYIPEAKWSDPVFLKELKGKVANKKKCLVGNSASEIDFRIVPMDSLKINALISKNDKLKEDGLKVEKMQGDTILKYNQKVELLKNYFFEFKQIGSLYSNKADYTILWFWTPDCSHCKKDTPKFYDLYVEKKLKEKNVEVIAVFMQKDISDWKSFTHNNDEWLAFIKEHKLYEWTHAWNPFDLFRRNYDIQSSPILYLLDKNKRILAKKISYEQAIEIIESELSSKP